MWELFPGKVQDVLLIATEKSLSVKNLLHTLTSRGLTQRTVVELEGLVTTPSIYARLVAFINVRELFIEDLKHFMKLFHGKPHVLLHTRHMDYLDGVPCFVKYATP